MTFNASIVLVNQTGRSASENNTSPATPVSRKTMRNAHEPADSLTHLEEDEGSERSQDAPQPDPSGRKEAADQHLPGSRRQQDVEKLRDQERLEASGSREDHQRAERDGEVDVRNDAYRRAEGEVETAPHDGNGQDQDGKQDEERLLLAQFLVVPDIGADPSKQRRPVGDPADPRSGWTSETRPSSPRSRAAELLQRHRVDRLGCRPVARPGTRSARAGLRNLHRRIFTRSRLTRQPTPRPRCTEPGGRTDEDGLPSFRCRDGAQGRSGPHASAQRVPAARQPGSGAADVHAHRRRSADRRPPPTFVRPRGRGSFAGVISQAPATGLIPLSKRLRFGWVLEIIGVRALVSVYDWARDQLIGSEAVAFEHARQVIRAERFLGMYHEGTLQDSFLPYRWFIGFWNVFYGRVHFFVPIVVLVWLYMKAPARYLRWRNTLFCMLALALVGFWLYPLMPPRCSRPPTGSSTPASTISLVGRRAATPATTTSTWPCRASTSVGRRG